MAVPPTAKTDLRKAAKAARAAHVASLSPAEQCAAFVMLAGQVEAHIGDARVVAAYLAIGSEIDPLPLIDHLVRAGKTLALPHVTARRGSLRFLRWEPGDPLPAGPMGLRQPHADAPEVVPDVILTPLLAFDDALDRLGYGAGHYDMAFARLSDARRIGLAWEAQRVEQLPHDAWDVPLHAVATEAAWRAA